MTPQCSTGDLCDFLKADMVPTFDLYDFENEHGMDMQVFRF